MYLTAIPRRPRPVFSYPKSAKATIPNRATDIKKAKQNMALGSLEDRAGAFYESMGIQIPDFRMMDKIEKLQALNHYAKDVEILTKKAQSFEDQQEQILKHKKQKADATKAITSKAQGQGPAGTEPAGPAGK